MRDPNKQTEITTLYIKIWPGLGEAVFTHL